MNDSVRILHGDALTWLDLLPSNSFDCIVTDPPYGSTQNAWDVAPPLEALWPQLLRVCSGPIVMSAIQPFSSALVQSQPKIFRHEIIWEKNKASGHLNAKRAPLRCHETILVFCAGPITYNPQMSTGHKPGNYAKRTTLTSNYGAQKESVPYGGATSRYPRSVQRFDVVNNDSPDRFHPTQKPVDLFEFLIATYSNPGGRVLDPFAGSGTTGLAALRSARRATLIELNADYVEIIKQRLSAA